jgi:hypothetical protein
MGSKPVLALLALGVFCTGCGDKDNVDTPIKAFPHATARGAPSVDLSSGKIDPQQVGVWKNATDTYTFRPDGTFELFWDRMVTVRPGQQERKTASTKGKWSVAGDNILMESDKGVRFKLVRILSNGNKTLEMHALYVKTGPMYQRVSANAGVSAVAVEPKK